MKLSFDFQKVIEFKDPFAPETFTKLKRSLLAIMLRQKDKLFQASTDPDGKAWEPLHSLSASRKNKKSKKTDAQIQELQKTNKNFAQHKILIDTGALKNSLTSAVAPYSIRSTDNSDISLGTNLPYAKIQNFGGQLKRNGSVVGNIVARPYIGFGFQDDQQITEKISSFVSKEIKK